MSHPIKIYFTMILMLSFHISSSANAQEELLFTDLNDMKINLVLEKDITYVFQAWASWCANCSKAIERVDNVIEKLDDKKIKLITVSIDDESTGAKGYFQKNHAVFSERNLAVLRDPVAKILRGFKLKSVPATIIIHKTGKTEVLHGFPELLKLENSIVSH
jgi:thiol-disulfide isomerase/thioredoxin